MDQSRHESAPLADVLKREADRSAQCPAHGIFTSRNVFGKVWSKCPTCTDEENKRLAAERAASERRAQAALAEERMNRRLAESGLLGRFEGATFDNFEVADPKQEAARTACRSFVESLDAAAGGLWLVGPPGTGKTHLGSAMVNHVIRARGEWAAIHSAREIVRMLRATWAKERKDRPWGDAPFDEEGLIEHLGSIRLLVLDEVGGSFGSDSEMVQLFDVIDQRYRNERPTVLLSNLPAQELKPALGDRAYDRLREGAILVPCRWESHRSSGSRV